MRAIVLLSAVVLLTACATTRDSASISTTGHSGYNAYTGNQIDRQYVERVNRSVRGRYAEVVWVNPPIKRAQTGDANQP